MNNCLVFIKLPQSVDLSEIMPYVGNEFSSDCPSAVVLNLYCSAVPWTTFFRRIEITDTY